jgi:23S rRNA (pseudouridine1915-N3)-methyltransferase
MKIQVIWVGKTKEGFAKEAIGKYLKLASPFCEISMVEIKEDRSPDRKRGLEHEGQKILKAASDFVLLHEEGRELTSGQFADFLRDKHSCAFVVGGPFGVSEKVQRKAEAVISLSRMTFPHDLARVILLEQIYRGLTIICKRGYHH